MPEDVATRIVETVEVFTSAENRPYAYIPCPGNVLNLQAVPLRSAAFRNWFFAEHLSHVTYVPSPPAFRAILDLLESNAFRAEDRLGWPVHRRVGSLRTGDGPGTLFLDLANPCGDIVEITAGGWKLQSESSVPFEPSAAARPIPTPEQSPGDPLAPLETLRSCLNISSEGWRRCLAWLLAALQPDGPHPVLILQGPSGSGKSFAARVLRTLVDPATAPLAATPTSAREVAGLARRHWVVALDHISRLSPNVADALGRLGSGLGHSFYEELRGRGAQPVEVNYRRPVILTVAGEFICPENIASHALTVDFPAIPPDRRRTETDLRDVVNPAFSSIVGALLTLLSAGLRTPSTFPGPQPAPDIQRREDPGGVPLVPLQGPPREETPHIVQQEVPAEGQFHADDLEAVRRTGECREILPGEVLEAPRGHVPLVGRIDVGVVRAEMRSGDEHLGSVPRHPVDLRHGPHRIVQVLDHVRHVDPGETIALQRPGIRVEIPDMVGRRIGRDIDPDRTGLDLSLPASDVENHP